MGPCCNHCGRPLDPDTGFTFCDPCFSILRHATDVDEAILAEAKVRRREAASRRAATWGDAMKALDDVAAKTGGAIGALADMAAAALTPDPDPDKDLLTMTDTTDAPALHTLNRSNGEKLTARNAEEVADLITICAKGDATKDFMQKARNGEGTGTLGLYVEAVAFNAHGKPMSHMKFFVIGEHLYAYNRQNGDTRANWRHRVVASLADALGAVQAALDKPSVKLFGHPVMVELTPDDLSAVETNQMPPSRFRGESRIARSFERYDFDPDTAVESLPVPSSLTKMLRTPQFVTPPF
jgi:uncharacterized Zn finger protein (UPF0148 family)